VVLPSEERALVPHGASVEVGVNGADNEVAARVGHQILHQFEPVLVRVHAGFGHGLFESARPFRFRLTPAAGGKGA